MSNHYVFKFSLCILHHQEEMTVKAGRRRHYLTVSEVQTSDKCYILKYQTQGLEINPENNTDKTGKSIAQTFKIWKHKENIYDYVIKSICY